MKSIFTIVILFISLSAAAQISKPDTAAKKLNEVVVKGYYNNEQIIRSVSAVSLIDSNLLKYQPKNSMVSALNTVAGIRMEERSPGSYRLSLRGSLLRSPFGIRNIKIYVDDFPLTDAGGNTYLNLIDATAIQQIEIYKGPEASIFGANTGGAVLINNPEFTNNIQASITGGSFGLLHQTASFSHQFKNYGFSFNQGYQKSDGYRENSGMERKYFQTNHQWNYNQSGILKAFIFYSDLAYETPGGLTQLQMDLNPQQARPATPTIPGAVTQQAAIYNKTIFGGLSNVYQFNDNFKHVVSVFTSYTDFKNPFITNFENRYESTLGLRTFLEYRKSFNNLVWNTQLGLESSATRTQIKNFNNNAGIAGSMQAYDDLKAYQDFGFFRTTIDIDKNLLVELATSLNFFKYKYQSFFPALVNVKERKFSEQFMPKLAISYLINQNIAARGSISKGYSPPTIAEVRSSDNNINNNLQAENGWNYEFGLRYKSLDNRFYINTNVYQFQLKDAIVRRLNANDTEFFINAGRTNQKGIELETAFWILKNETGFLNALEIRSNYTLSKYSFEEFSNATTDFSGNKLTGVPTNVVVSSLNIQLKGGFYIFGQHNYTSSIPLNDANTVFAKKYNLIEAKAGVNALKVGKVNLNIFIGINNLLNEMYSLGNDLNAVNNRYFNPAATRNYYLGTTVKL
ncbi:TonB-dependent receptor [Pedobacter aquatilis]|uniref:TonB-dependent receptor n=1 Tax=Pedobacter aquatilis TaxID=351343 RepID=UPI0025B3DE98|nr:TonB-dependent receptor [Pedobacter aquatilis]MDN3586313.1 TonB-dependent receptor [Pedobacter aquatilis]